MKVLGSILTRGVLDVLSEPAWVSFWSPRFLLQPNKNMHIKLIGDWGSCACVCVCVMVTARTGILVEVKIDRVFCDFWFNMSAELVLESNDINRFESAVWFY